MNLTLSLFSRHYHCLLQSHTFALRGLEIFEINITPSFSEVHPISSICWALGPPALYLYHSGVGAILC
jgi:hypothetical protein